MLLCVYYVVHVGWKQCTLMLVYNTRRCWQQMIMYKLDNFAEGLIIGLAGNTRQQTESGGQASCIGGGRREHKILQLSSCKQIACLISSHQIQ